MTGPNYSHDHPADLSEWEYRATLGLADYPTDLILYVSKVGGGTIGRGYVGAWHYRAETPDGEVVAEGWDLETGSPTSHHEAAAIVADFLAEGADR